MFAYEQEEEYSENEANYHSYQNDQSLAYPRKAPKESFAFKHENEEGFGLPDYYGQGEPKPIEIKN